MQVQASVSKTVEKPALSYSSTVYGPISIKLVNEPVISAIKKVAMAVHLRPVLDNDFIKKDKKVNLTLEVASLSEALDQILLGMEIQYSITESGLLVFTQEQAQENQAKGSGSLKGQVLDSQTKDPLPGANVVIKGTSLGASTDIDGTYILYNVPVGTQAIVASYVGYVPTTVKVDVTKNSSISQNIYLKSTEIEGEAVVITGQAHGQLQAINQQISSDKITNIVSEERIQQLPDFNAAQAISRLPGVSTTQSSGEAQKVVIRGMAPQYNNISIGGISLASTGSNQIGITSLGGGVASQDRSVDLTMVTPYMIKTIQLFKSLTPDMNANAIGGFVNMELREAPSGLKTDVVWQSGYTQMSDTYGNYRAMVSASDRFFNDKLGIYVLANAENYDRSADNLSAGYNTSSSVHDSVTGYRPVNSTSVTLDRHIETRKRYRANLILDYTLPSGSIQLVNMFSRLNSNYKDYNTTYDFYFDHNINFTFNDGETNTDLSVNSLNLTNDFGFMSVNLKAANTYSRNNRPNSHSYSFMQTGGSATSLPNERPEDVVKNAQYKGDTLVDLQNINLYSADYKENDQEYKADFKMPFNISSNISGYFQFGGDYRYNLHTNHQSTPYISPSGTLNGSDINAAIVSALVNKFNLKMSGKYFPGSDFTSSDPKLYKSFLDNKFGQMCWITDPTLLSSMTDYLSTNPAFASVNSTGGWFDGIYQEKVNDYKYIEKYFATYAMTQFNIGQSFLVVGGVRYEETKSLYDAYNMVDLRNNPPNQPYYPVSAFPESHNLLPQVQTKYDLTDWCDLRYSYTQTLARPDYTQLSPHYVINTTYTSVMAGNPNLKPAQAYNHDAEITIHDNYIGLLSFSYFYKTIEHFIYNTSYSLYSASSGAVIPVGLDSVGSFPLLAAKGSSVSGQATVSTYINSPYNATVKGIEADYQTSFWYLPVPLNGIVLGVNYTHISSEAKYPYLFVINVPNPANPRRSVPELVDSSVTARLVLQPNDILNAYIGYDYKGFSGRVSFVFQGNSVTYISSSQSETDGYTKDYFRVDASARYILPPWPNVQIFLDVFNINKEANISQQQSINGFTSENFYGLTANFGIRYTL